MIKAIAILNLVFFNDTATTEIYTLSLHDALPISRVARLGHRAARGRRAPHRPDRARRPRRGRLPPRAAVPARIRLPDRKSTRLNSSHANISYAAFCLKKKKASAYASYE